MHMLRRQALGDVIDFSRFRWEPVDDRAMAGFRVELDSVDQAALEHA